MKLSRTAWNNVIIISVMSMILLINVMNGKLFPENSSSMTNNKGEQLLLAKHSVILTLEVPHYFTIERSGQSWRLQQTKKTADVNTTQHTEQSSDVNFSAQAIEQMMQAWQHSAGLLQADDIEVEGMTGISVIVYLADSPQPMALTLYPLIDQLLIHEITSNRWIALSPQLFRQLLPLAIYPEQP